jgi:hypothetical protein
VQHENVLIQMTRVPSTAPAQLAEVVPWANLPGGTACLANNPDGTKPAGQWYDNWARDFKLRFPTDSFRLQDKLNDNFKVPGIACAGGTWTLNWNEGKRSLIHLIVPNTPAGTIAKVATPHATLPITFFKLENTYLAIRSLCNAMPTISTSGTRVTVSDATADFDRICGFVVEVGDSTTHGSYADFQSAAAAAELDLTNLAAGQVRYRTIDGDEIDVQYGYSGHWVVPDFDWDWGVTTAGGKVSTISSAWQQPGWPQGDGHGRVASWSVNGAPVRLDVPWPMFDGPHVKMDDRRLRITDGESAYTVDFRGPVPWFYTTPN